MEFRNVRIMWDNGTVTDISKDDIDRMIKAKDAIETIAYALQIARELNNLNKKREEV